MAEILMTEFLVERSRLVLVGLLFVLPVTSRLPAQGSDIDAIASEEIELPRRRGLQESAPKRSYFLIGPRAGAEKPAAGYGLVVVLPGGNGGRTFHPFVKRIYQHALGADWIVAQPIAVAWARSKSLVWPTQKDAIPGQVLGTEVFVEDVISDVAKRHTIDPSRVLLLTWSSGGPAAYAISLQKRKSITGFFIAMSVFKPAQLPPPREARDEAYFLLHSPDDAVCPYRMAQEAEATLKKVGARVEFQSYDGGHGWRGNVYGMLRQGFQWLDEHHSAPDKKMWPKSRRERRDS